jgi:DNA-binding MarR family transcriptional regulator
MVDRFAQFVAGISCISRCIQKIERDVMVHYGLKGPHAQYLIAMSRYPDGVTATQLSSLCEKDKAAVSRAVSELEKNGLIHRAGEGNSYRAMLTLTVQGKKAADQLIRQAEIAVEQAGLGLTDDARATFYSAFNLIVSNLQRISEDGLN